MGCSICKNRELCKRENLVCMNIRVCFRCDEKENCKMLCRDMREYLKLTAGSRKSYKMTKTWNTDKIDLFVTPEEHTYVKRYSFDIKNVPMDILSARDRELVIAHVMEGITYNKICRIFGGSAKDIQQIVQKSLQKLKTYYYLREAIKNNKKELTGLQYKYLNLHYVNNIPVEEIANVDLKTPRSVRRVIQRGKERLEGYLEI